MYVLYVLIVIFNIFVFTYAQHDLVQRDTFKNRSNPDDCYTILNSFANLTSNFTLCSILNARPITLCEKCIDNYVLFHAKYQELLHTVVNGTSCGSLFMSQDRLNIIQHQHDNILDVWNTGNCNGCFDWKEEKPVLKNSTETFISMYKETMKCIKKYMNNNVCENCMQFYMPLDDFYKSLSADSIGVDSVCMDIVDSMNATRSIWSKTLNCCNLRRSPEILFLCSAVIISLLPLFYYISVRYCGPIRDLPNVLKQSRFKQTILRTIEKRNE